MSLFKKLIARWLARVSDASPATGPTVYPRSEHCISRAQISDNALKVLYRLDKLGYQSYLVGGCVRDLLLGREPKDFDVVTNARPEQIKSAFRNCRLIGRRFRLAHVRFGSEVIEVATFRASASETDCQDDGDRVMENGRVLRDNVYGSIEEDAWRRDFGVNALYYNIRDFSVVDYVGGMRDHQAGRLCVIGDPEQRYREDPVRMLRAVRFASKLGFNIAEEAELPLQSLSGLLQDIPSARLYDEVLKLFLSGCAVQTFERLRHYHLFEHLFPQTEKSLTLEEDGFPLTFVVKALENTDLRLSESKPVTPYFLLAALLWEPVHRAAELRMQEGEDEFAALQAAGHEVIGLQIRSVAFPRRIGALMREVWTLQPRFKKCTGSRPVRLLGHPRFRAAYDFLLLRAETGGADPALAEWWGRFQSCSEHEQRKMTNGKSLKRRRRKTRSRNRSTGARGGQEAVSD